MQEVQWRIKIDHQLQYINGEGLVIQEPKTESGVRFVPMTDEVAECFRTIIARRENPKIESLEITGVSRIELAVLCQVYARKSVGLEL